MNKISYISRHAILLILFLIVIVNPISGLCVALKDPTMPPNYRADQPRTEVSKPKKLVLSAIFNKPTGNSAVINQKIVSVGDLIDGYSVLTIDAETVTLKNASGKVLVLRLYGSVQNEF